MDFSKLTLSELNEFLTANESENSFPQGTLADRAQTQFNRLSQKDDSIYTVPVVDLYLASIYDGPRDVIYTPEDINNLTRDEVQQFAELFQFNPADSSFTVNRERVRRILKFLGLIESQDTLPGPALEALFESMSIEDILNYLDASSTTESFNVQVSVADRHNIINSIIIDNDVTPLVALQIRTDGFGKTLGDAVQLKKFNLVRKLIAAMPDVNAPISYGRNKQPALHRFAFSPTTVQILLNAGANVKTVSGYDEQTALFTPNIHADSVRLLVAKGAKINKLDVRDKIPLMTVHDEAAFKAMVEAGADLKAQDDNGWNALMIRVSERISQNLLEYILSKEIDINARNSLGKTALYILMEKSGPNIEVARTLLEHGADPNIPDIDGKTVLARARDPAMKALIESYGGQ